MLGSTIEGMLSAHGIPTLGLPQAEGVGLLGLIGALVGGKVEDSGRLRRRKHDLHIRENFVAYSARRAAGLNKLQADATLSALAALSDRWRIGSITDDQYDDVLDDLLAKLPQGRRTQSYYADFVANGSRAELTTEIPGPRGAIPSTAGEFIVKYEDPPETP